MTFYEKIQNGVSVCALACAVWGGWSDYVSYQDKVQEITQKYSEIQKPKTSLTDTQCDTYCQSLSDSLSKLELPSHVNPETLQNALEFLHTKKGRELVSNMRSNVTFSANTNITDNSGYYNDKFREVGLTQVLNYGQKLPETEKQGEYADTIFHEFYHAYQYQQGILQAFGLSPEQFMTVKKLCEAEARVQGQLEGVIQRNNLRKDKEDMYYFIVKCELKQDDYNAPSINSHSFPQEAMPSGQKQTEEIRLGQRSPEMVALAQKQQKVKRELTPEMVLYDQLQTGVTLDIATQRAAAVMIKHYVGHDIPQQLTSWQQYYDKHGLGALQNSAKSGCISKDGNETAYNDILKYYETRYGLKREEIDHTGGIHPDNQSLFQKAVKKLEEESHLITLQKLIENDKDKEKDTLLDNLKKRGAQLFGVLIALSALSFENQKQKKQPVSHDKSIPQHPTATLQETPKSPTQSHVFQTLSRVSSVSYGPYASQTTNSSVFPQAPIANHVHQNTQKDTSTHPTIRQSVDNTKKDNSAQPPIYPTVIRNILTSR